MSRLRLGFLASHGGTSMRAIVAAIEAGQLNAEARMIVSNNADAPALAFARDHAIPARHISSKTAGSEANADVAICEAFDTSGCDWLIMSGYLRKLGPTTLRRFEGRILNIHPALLPKFGGRGMFGRHVHEAVLAAGETVSGITVHLVDGEYDHGTIIAQREVPVLPGDRIDDLQQRITAAEPPFFVEILQSLAAKHSA
jgi:phosphoribosylglycinamide formyltransferase-1